MNNNQLFLNNIEKFTERAKTISHLQKKYSLLNSELSATRDYKRKCILKHACEIIDSEIATRSKAQ